MRKIGYRAAAFALAALLVGGCSAPGTRSRASYSAASLPAPPEPDLEAAYLQALVARRPAHWRARVRLAALHTAASRHREAFAALLAALRAAPRGPGLHVAVAEAADTIDYLDWAIHGWREAARIDPADSVAQVRLARLYRRLDWIADADLVLAAAARRAPDALEVLRERAALAASSGLRVEARRLAERMKARHPRSPYGYSLLADAHAAAGRWSEAVVEGRAAVERAHGDPSFLVRLAQYHLLRTDAPDPAGGLRLLRAARELDPRHSGMRYWSGTALRRLGRAAEAARELEDLLQDDPDYTAAAVQLADLYRLSGRAPAAADLLARVRKRQEADHRAAEAAARLRREPLSAAAHLEMGRARLEARDLGAAVVEFLAARRLDPRLKAASDGLAEALREQGRKADSLAPLGTTGPTGTGPGGA